jgi:hypothetical protein
MSKRMEVQETLGVELRDGRSTELANVAKGHRLEFKSRRNEH